MNTSGSPARERFRVKFPIHHVQIPSNFSPSSLDFSILRATQGHQEGTSGASRLCKAFRIEKKTFMQDGIAFHNFLLETQLG